MLKQTTPLWRRALLGLVAVVLPLVGFAQNLTQADFTGLVVPQYASSGTATRVPVMYRATVSNLTPNTLYRYYNQAGISTDLGGSNSGAGNPLLITPGATPAATTYAYTSTASLTTAGSYATFTTSATGTYTGWFGYLNTGNVRFTAGNVLYMTLVLAPDAAPTVTEKRLALDQTLTVLAFGTGTAATDATGLKGSSAATPKNLVAVYDNVGGTGRPLGLTVAEAIAATGAAVNNLPTYYTAAAGDWNTLVPNVLPSGVRRVEQRSVIDGTVVGCASDADGVWPSGANTVSPATGTAAVALTATDAPLNTSTCGSAATATVTATPASLAAFSTVVGTPSATQTITVSGTALTAGIVATAPAGYELSLSAATGFAATATVPQTGGTAANTPVYVRLTGAATGTFAGNVALTSTGATAVNVAVTGTVTTVATPAPTITSFTPASGPVGTIVTVTGTNFTGATGATLNGTAVTGFMVMSATSVMFNVPAGATTGLIAVTTPGGTATSATSFTVTASAPTITSFTPASGPVGTTLTVTGTNFTGATGATLNGTAVTGFMVMSATSVMFNVPAGATTGLIAVTTPGGTATSSTSFTVTPAVAAPTVTSFAPARAVTGVGFTLNVSGTNLVAGTTINFNGVAYPGTIVGTAGTSYNAVIPGSGVPAPGTYPITATNTGGTSPSLSFLVVAPATTVAYEDFEQGTKGGYATGTVTLRSGDWTFTDALLGNLFNDRVNQVQAARIRGGGSIAMNFDKPNGAGVITLNAALYGSDATASFVLEISTNGGTTYTVVPGAPTALTTTLTPYSFTVNRAGNVRLRISSTNVMAATNPRINIDDLNITTYIGTATLASQALPGLSVFPNPATDRLTVTLPTAGAATVALRDLTGRVVLAPAPLGADKQLVLPVTLARGLYLLEVKQGDVLAVRRIEKN